MLDPRQPAAPIRKPIPIFPGLRALPERGYGVLLVAAEAFRGHAAPVCQGGGALAGALGGRGSGARADGRGQQQRPAEGALAAAGGAEHQPVLHLPGRSGAVP